MACRLLPKFAAVGVLSLGLLTTSPVVRADLVIEATVGGAPLGVSYAHFDNLAPGAAGGTSGGIAVSFTGNGRAVRGSVSGLYAAPYLSNGNGTPFGDPNNGADTTTYLTTGTGTVTLTLPGEAKYLGLLWGSVDAYNTLSFYDGSTLVGTVTGSQVTANAKGDQGQSGTFYVNITSTLNFNNVVASSTSNALELDNVAYNPVAVPEPSSLILGLAGAVGMITYGRPRRKGSRAGCGAR